MELIRKLEIELKVTWHKANLAKNETERGQLLKEYFVKYDLLKKQRVQIGSN